jgi:site-specific DNA-methyltransferase (adenine-specific)
MKLILGDCLEKMRELPDNSVDSVVTDPPYGIGFMNKEWDNPAKHRELIEREKKRSEERYEEGKSPAKGGFSKGVQPGLAIGTAKEGKWFQEWCEEWGKECLRVLKPGGYLLSFSAPRTYHRMTTGFEDAGFEIRDQIMWVFGSGFPKSLNLGEGWGTALKPAHEPICVARKPLGEKTNKENMSKWGTGGLNIDETRIGYKDDKPHSIPTEREGGNSWNKDYQRTEDWEPNNTGRWPANIIFDEEAGEILDQQSGVKQYNKGREEGNYKGGHRKDYVGTDDNPIVNKVDGKFFSDKGGASRFFYCPKASKKDRDEGMDGFEEKHKQRMWAQSELSTNDYGSQVSSQPHKNNHPTVKPTELMLYLIKLVTPKGGTVLEPFMGSGSTGKACVRGGFDFIGIEKEEEYYNISQARINNELK